MHEVTHVSPVFLRLLRVTLPQDTSCLHTSENRLFEDVFFIFTTPQPRGAFPTGSIKQSMAGISCS